MTVVSERARRYREKNREKINRRQRERYLENPERQKEYQRRYVNKYPERVKINKFRCQYRLTTEQAHAAVLRMNGSNCDACGGFSKLQIDHCHATGKVRGMLCWPCNISLGNVKDSSSRLRALADYLDRTL